MEQNKELMIRFGSRLGKIEDQIISVLKNSGKPLSLVEITDQIEKSQKIVYKALRKLFEKGKIDCDVKSRRYTLTKE